MLGHEGPNVSVEGFDGPLEMLLGLVEEKKLDILTVRLGELADAYLTRVRALDALPAEEVASFLALASRLVLLKARSLLPALEPIEDEDESEGEQQLKGDVESIDAAEEEDFHRPSRQRDQCRID